MRSEYGWSVGAEIGRALDYASGLSFTVDRCLMTVAAITGAGQTIYAFLIRTTGLKPWIDAHLVH